jgi:catechol 2,3-dioxygenase-like lactoylglutathione lyase family enzyme
VTLRLDHLVIFVSDLDRASADYRSLGFTVNYGGEHPGGTTHNALVVFADGAYLELIAFRRSDEGNRWWRVGSAAGEGFVDFALLPEDMAADVAAAQARGLDLVGPIPGGRARPDGARLEWQTARSPQPDVPFLCGDITPRSLRVQEGEVRRHPNGVTGVASVSVAVEDLDRSLARYAAYLGIDLGATPASHVVAGFGIRAATLPLGDTALTLVSPLPGSVGPVRDALVARGEGPFAAAFRADGSGVLDLGLTHGAKLELVGPAL